MATGAERLDSRDLSPLMARVELWAAVGVALVGSAMVVRRMDGYFVDDAYITMRFAENLIAGDGWTYNAGEQTANGATSPGFTLAVAAVSVLARVASRATNVVFVASFGVAAAFLAAIFRRHEAPWVAMATILALMACPLLLATKGMESLPFLALVCGVLWASDSGRDVWFGILVVLLVLVRGEGILLAGTVFVWLWVARRRFPMRALCAGALAALPWAVYSLVVFQSVIPDTLAAKVAQGDSGYWGDGRVFFSWAFDIVPMFHSDGWLRNVVPLAVAGLVRGCADRRLRPLVLPLVIATVLHVVAYGLVLDVPGYPWYYAWEVFTLGLLAALAIGWVAEQCVNAARGRRFESAAIVGATATIAVGALLAADGSPVRTTEIFLYKDVPQYAEVGYWLAANTAPDARIAATEIGAIGWYSERPMVDYLGLLNKASISELRRGDLRSWLEREEPDYWVVHDPLSSQEEPAAAQDWFDLAYEPIYTTEPGLFGVRLVVYEHTMDIADAKAVASD